MKKNAIARAADIIRKARAVAAFTGAGVSTESGIPDFRSAGGLWSRYDPMEYGTISSFRSNPEKIWKMLAELLSVIDAQPNPGHLALAELERNGYLAGIVTQNIDGLHQKAGSSNVIEFHGSFDSFSCLACGKQHSREKALENGIPPRCPKCRDILKPDIVFFDEQISVQTVEASQTLLSQCDVLIVAGTSCQVMPAARLPLQLHARGGKIIEINPDPALNDFAEVVLAGKFASTMAQLADAVCGTRSKRLR